MELLTIGFTKKTAQDFFEALTNAGIKTLIDIRLNNKSQLAGFSKQADLEYFLREICSIRYIHEPLLTPAEEMFRAYRSKTIGWEEFGRQYKDLLRTRDVSYHLDQSVFQERAVLLCSEPEADRCHRRWAAEHLRDSWGGLDLVHL